ncbi:hypothetical protein SteCoe_19759 [Stentor coeruleus]|uniref:CHCH domain-containing protein n=1 Tax=Stentor coeruleus TaxID=5963 RepID=A0A1R2BTC2_9CILI|nr:hypothetical protein SteCoe_19759 [Stentor coeruleus]
MHRKSMTHAPNAPDKGSFPLDHFQECEILAEKYRLCLAASSGIPKKCKDEAKNYLECRMNKGLMAKQNMEELGFIPESSWEFEQLSKKEKIEKVQKIIQESRERVRKEYEERQRGNN